MIEITLIDANDFVLSTTLDNDSFKLRFSWNDTGAYWTLGIMDDKSNSIIRNIKLVPNYPLLAQHRISSLPKGEFICVTSNAAIARDDFIDSKAHFVYVPEDELDGAV